MWAGGSIDRGNNEQPGVVVGGPEGAEAKAGGNFALSAEAAHAYALLVKTEAGGIARCLPAGKPLEIKVAKDKDRFWIGFNDERGRFADNHIGKGRRHERDPLWIRIEVVRIVVSRRHRWKFTSASLRAAVNPPYLAGWQPATLFLTPDRGPRAWLDFAENVESCRLSPSRLLVSPCVFRSTL